MTVNVEKTEISELTTLDPDRLDGVFSPANGTPFLLLKASASTASDEDGLEDMTDEAAKSLCLEDGCEVCAPVLAKAKLKAKQRNALPKSAFAIPSKRAFPIHDESHARNALARASGKPEEAQVKAAVHRKYPNIGAEKSAGVPDNATHVDVSMEGGRVRATGLSGQRMAPMVSGTRAPISILTPGGEERPVGGSSTQVIPVEANVVNPPQTTIAATKVAYAVTSLFEAAEAIAQGRQRLALKGSDWLAMDNPSGDAATAIGSGPWESFDSATLSSVAENLAACGMAIDAIQKREAIEAAAGDVGDIQDTYDLGSANDALNFALGIVARLAFHEGAAAMKSDDTFEGHLSKATETALIAARDHLSRILGGSIQAGEPGVSLKREDGTMTEVSTTELGAIVAKAATDAVAADRAAAEAKAAKSAKKEAKKAAKRAKKNANNGGDVTAGDLTSQVKGHVDSNDIGAVGTGPDLAKSDDEIKDIRKELKEARDLLKKALDRPRVGGPNLTGVIPATEGRHGEEAVKSAEDGEIERLTKELEDAQKSTGPEAMNRAAGLSYQLTRATLRQGHRTGELGGPGQ